MKQLKVFLTGLIIFIGAFLIASPIVYADDTIQLMESYTGDESISLYFKNVGENAEANALIGTELCDDISSISVADLKIPVKTLVMVDNSLSIKDSDRKKIAEFLQNLISDRIANEEIAIATFDQEIRYACDYSDDYTTLKSAIDGISHQNLETYLTDVLYDLIQEMIQNPEDVYQRIIVISDGVDNKYIGYTKDELYSLLKDNSYPIYTIGSLNKKKNNNAELENMYALSRMTNALSFTLDDYSNMLDVSAQIAEEKDVTKFVISPSSSMLDGSRKAVKITIGGNDISVEVKMPQKEKEEVSTEPKPTPEPTAAKTVDVPIPNTATPIETPNEVSAPSILPIIIAIVAVLVVVAIVLFVFMRKKRQSKKEVFEEFIEDREIRTEITGDEGTTELIFDDVPEDASDSNTQGIWNEKKNYALVLTDVNSPIKSFRVTLRDAIVIGRGASCTIVLDYDKSVSGKHCEISENGGRFYVRDLGSSNKTYVNGEEVVSKTEIFSGAVLKLGRLEMRVDFR